MNNKDLTTRVEVPITDHLKDSLLNVDKTMQTKR